jgi:hypothetical protein
VRSAVGPRAPKRFGHQPLLEMTRLSRGSRLSASIWQVVGLAVGIAVTFALTRHHVSSSALIVIALLAALIVVGSLVRAEYRSGAIIGIAVVAALDGLPGPDLTTTIVKSGLYAEDFVIYALIGLLVLDISRNRLWGFFGSGIGRCLLVFALLNIAWWMFTLYRTTGMDDVNVRHAANFARDFMYVAVLTPLFAAAMQRAQTRDAMFAVIGAWSLVLGATCIIGAVHQSSLTVELLHVTTIRHIAGVTRLYVHAQDLLAACFGFGCAFALTSASARRRRFGAIVAVTCGLAVGLLQTRAAYLGCIGGIVIASCVYLRGRSMRYAGMRMLVGAAMVAAVIVALLAFAPNSQETNAVSELGSRVSSIVGTASSQSTTASTVAVRKVELQLLEQRLGGSWLLGLGFVDPRDVYDPNLPFGTIRNTDVGLFNVVMTMGVVGTVLYYLSLMTVTLMLVVRSRRIVGESRVYAYGALAGCVMTLITSITLVTFFGPTGISSVAAMIGVGAAAIGSTTAPPAIDHDALTGDDGRLVTV